MSSSKSRAYRTLVSAMTVGLAACSNSAGDAASRIAAPSDASRHEAAVMSTATVCKAGSSPSGSYSFSTVNTGTTNNGDVLTSPVVLVVVNGGPDVCAPVFTRSESAGQFSDAPAILTITEAAAAGTTLGNITYANSEALTPVIDLEGRKITVGLNAFHQATATFFNVADHVAEGCTYTQGWYKNPKHQWPAGFSRDAQFDGGLSWINLYNTPPKGSAYIQLAHQYMTAQMNIASGASVPADVQVAYDKATAYFAAGGAGAGSGDIAGVAAILDAYNNGVAVGGPAHCG